MATYTGPSADQFATALAAIRTHKAALHQLDAQFRSLAPNPRIGTGSSVSTSASTSAGNDDNDNLEDGEIAEPPEDALGEWIASVTAFEDGAGQELQQQLHLNLPFPPESRVRNREVWARPGAVTDGMEKYAVIVTRLGPTVARLVGHRKKGLFEPKDGGDVGNGGAYTGSPGSVGPRERAVRSAKDKQVLDWLKGGVDGQWARYTRFWDVLEVWWDSVMEQCDGALGELTKAVETWAAGKDKVSGNL